MLDNWVFDDEQTYRTFSDGTCSLEGAMNINQKVTPMNYKLR